MKAVIMAGGKGTRLYPLTRRIPKPMVPLLDRPVMEYMVDLLHRQGIREVGVTLGHMADAIRMYFGDGRRFLVRMASWDPHAIHYANTGIYIMEPEVLSFIPKDLPYDFGHDLFPNLVQLGMPIYGHHAKGYWSDIGTLRQYYQTQLDLLSGKVELPLSEDILLVSTK